MTTFLANLFLTTFFGCICLFPLAQAKKKAPSQDDLTQKTIDHAVDQNATTTMVHNQHEPKQVRVLLDEQTLDTEPHLVVQSKTGFTITAPIDSPAGIGFDVEELHILCTNNRLYLQCKDGKHRRLRHNSLEISNTSKELTVGGKTYQGSIIIRIDRDEKKVLIINKVDLEDYIYSVVRYECIPSWPLEMQKLQAIISRSYAAYQMTLARTSKPLYKYYDIRNTNFHQVYNGSHTIAHIRQAVEETRNMVLTYKGAIALTMFDICCGGVKPSQMRCKDTSKPYLMRSTLCTHCIKSPHYQWKVDMSKTLFLNKLQAQAQSKNSCTKIKSIQSIAVLDADRAGIVHKVKIVGNNNKRILLSGRDIRRALSPQILSLNFKIKLIGDRIVIHGKGHGHQKGVCQFGCKELLARGWSLNRVLDFYYPGTTLSRLA